MMEEVSTVKKPYKLKIDSSQEKETQISSLNQETEGLFVNYREVMDLSAKTDLFSRCGDCSSLNSMVALMMEEMSLPLSKLVVEIFSELKEKMQNVTMEAVKSVVVSVGQRMNYGIPNLNVDVLEDNTESCLWCWETRDLKLIPKSLHGLLKDRRIFRKMIHERIVAVSAIFAALQRTESEELFRFDLRIAAEKLDEIFSEVDIRSYVENMKNSTEMAEKESKRKEKLLLKQLGKTSCEVENKKIRMDCEILKDRLQQEQEQKTNIDENDEEKEESESKEGIKKQRDESERKQKHREQEQVKLNKQLQKQKQTTIMERFLKRSKNSSLTQPKLSSTEVIQELSCTKHDEESKTVIEISDDAFSKFEARGDDIHRSYSEFQSPYRGSRERSDSTRPSLMPETHSRKTQVTTVEELVQRPGRNHLPMLHPYCENGATWFNLKNGITKSILRMIHTKLPKAYPTYNDFPRKLQEAWFRSFAKDFNWKTEFTSIIYKEFNRKATSSYNNNLYQWKQNWVKGKGRPKNCNVTLWRQFIKYWNLEKTKEISAINSKNRRSDRGGKGMATHNSGPISFKSREYKLMQERGGVRPDWLVVMEDTHTNKKTGEIQDKKVKELIEIFKKKKTDNMSREEVNRMIFKETLCNNGSRSGLGTLPNNDKAFSSHQDTQDPKLVQDLNKFQQIVVNREEEITELKKTQEELTRKQSEHHDIITSLQEFIQQAFSGYQNQDPNMPI